MRRCPTLVSSSWLGKGTRPWTRGPSSSRARLSGLWKGLNSRRRFATSFSGLRNCLIHPSAWKGNYPKFACITILRKPPQLLCPTGAPPRYVLQDLIGACADLLLYPDGATLGKEM